MTSLPTCDVYAKNGQKVTINESDLAEWKKNGWSETPHAPQAAQRSSPQSASQAPQELTNTTEPDALNPDAQTARKGQKKG